MNVISVAASRPDPGRITACAPIQSYSGFQTIESDPKDVKIGVDTKSTVRGRLGSPSATSTFDTNTWFYMNQMKSRVAFKRPQIIARNVTAIAFDKDSEVVKSVNNYTLKDGKRQLKRVLLEGTNVESATTGLLARLNLSAGSSPAPGGIVA